MLSTGSFERSDLFEIHNFVQNTQLSYPKEMIIGILRQEFSKDSYYHFVADEWGFPKIKSLENTPTDTGYHDDNTSRIFIGEAYRFDVVFYPALIVKSTTTRSVPLSINRNKYCIEYDKILFTDGYGNEKWKYIPAYFDLAGVFEDKMEIEVFSRDIRDRDSLCSIIMMLLQDVRFESLRNAGILVSNISAGGYSETEDREQEKLYKATVSFDSRGEWRRLIPIKSTIDHISLCVEFGNVSTGVTDPNFELNTEVNLTDQTFSDFILGNMDKF